MIFHNNSPCDSVSESQTTKAGQFNAESSPAVSGCNKDDNKNIAKSILDKYATGIVKKSSVYEIEVKDEKTGEVKKEACVNSNNENKLNYGDVGYSEDIVLWEVPLNFFVCEFEESREKNEKYIRMLESAAKGFNYDYYVADHGGKSPYYVMCIKDMPLGDDNKKAKLLLASSILPSEALRQLDKTNLGFTLFPVVGHPHWKPKYKGAVHKIMRGKSPLEHVNNYPKELLKKLKESKKRHDKVFRENKKSNEWLIDFFFEYCTTHELPGGERHHIIEKNMTALLLEHPDWELLKKKYLEAQKRNRDTFRTWEVAVLNGEFKEPSAGEVYNYIKRNNINYEIPKDKESTEPAEKKPINESDVVTKLQDKNLIKNIHRELSKYHIKDDIEKLATFTFAITGYLHPAELHKTVNLLGDSSVGKDNNIKSTLRLLPHEDWLFITRGTTATLEDDIAQYKIIAFSELNTNTEDGANNAIVETMKQICEGGTSALKKDMLTRETKHIVQEQKAVLWGSTETKKDDELETRGTCITILSDPAKTKAVNEKSCYDVSDINSVLKNVEKQESWVCDCIRYLRDKNRFVYAPFMPLLSSAFDNNNPRSQRDVKRFIALVLAIAWLHQEQRFIIKLNKNEFVVASPVDILMAFEIASPFLNQSYTGFDARFNAILEALKGQDMTRAEIQKLAHIGSVNTIKERIDVLKDKGLIEYVYEETIDKFEKKHSELKRRNNSPVIRSLSVAYQTPIISLSVNEIKERLKNGITVEHLSSLSDDKDEIDRHLTTIRQAINNYKELFIDGKITETDKPISDSENIPHEEKNIEKKQEKQKNQEKNKDSDTFSKNDRLKVTGLKKLAPINILKDRQPRTFRQLLEETQLKESELNELLDYHLRLGEIVESPVNKYKIVEDYI